MFLTKIKSAAAVLLVVLAVAGGGTLASLPTATGKQPPAAEKEEGVKQTAVKKAEPPGDTDAKKLEEARIAKKLEEARKAENQVHKKLGEARKLEGVWTVVSVKDANKKTLDSDPIFSHAAVTQTPARNVRLSLQAGKFALKSGPVSLEGVYKVDTSTAPEQIITLTINHRPGMLLSMPATYTLDGDNLTVTFVLPPSEANRLAESLVGVVYTLKREAQPKGDAAGPQPPAIPGSPMPRPPLK